jgi:hypothetical protein
MHITYADTLPPPYWCMLNGLTQVHKQCICSYIWHITHIYLHKIHNTGYNLLEIFSYNSLKILHKERFILKIYRDDVPQISTLPQYVISWHFVTKVWIIYERDSNHVTVENLFLFQTVRFDILTPVTDEDAALWDIHCVAYQFCHVPEG